MTSAFRLGVSNKTAVSICTILSRLSRKKTSLTPYFPPPRALQGSRIGHSRLNCRRPGLSSLISERRPLQREGMDFGFTAGHVAGPLEESTLLDGKGGGVHITDQFSR